MPAPRPLTLLTTAQRAALRWLRNRNGDGVFDKTGILVAAGERAPIMRGTWNRLRDAGMVEEYAERRRLRVTEEGLAVDLQNVTESQPSWVDLCNVREPT